MKAFLQGKWLNHPLHPLLVHLPTALWPTAFIIDILTQVAVDSNVLVRVSFYAIGLGLLAALLAIPTGLADWWDISSDKPAYKLGLYHLSLNLLITAIQAVNLALRWGESLDAPNVPPLPFIWLSGFATLLLLISGYLGGRMVYAYGTSVARNSKERWRRIAEAGKANIPSG